GLELGARSEGRRGSEVSQRPGAEARAIAHPQLLAVAVAARRGEEELSRGGERARKARKSRQEQRAGCGAIRPPERGDVIGPGPVRRAGDEKQLAAGRRESADRRAADLAAGHRQARPGRRAVRAPEAAAVRGAEIG